MITITGSKVGLLFKRTVEEGKGLKVILMAMMPWFIGHWYPIKTVRLKF